MASRADQSAACPLPELERLDLARLRRRRGEKWQIYPPDVLPAWVAEMDFPLAAPIRRVLEDALEADDLGYPINPRPQDLPTVFAERMAERFGWQVDPHRVEVLTDVVQGIYVALDRFAAPGEGVVVQTPVYPPFLHAVRETGRRLVENPLVEGAARWELDLDGLRAALDPATRVLLLCHPQNPTGRVFERRELEALAELALRHQLVVVSDEIHADLVYPGARHVPFATLGPEVEARTITLTSATKAFNIPGLRCALAHFGSAELRRRFLSLPRHIRGGVGSLGLAATAAAWRESQPWLDAVLRQLEAHRSFVAEFVRDALPGVGHRPPEASYLAWLDCRGLGLGPSPQRFFLERAKVALSAGEAFGRPGEGFVRLNFATSRALLGEILERMAKALRERGA
jgi:cysteine-S-conjugate beta-lyase